VSHGDFTETWKHNPITIYNTRRFGRIRRFLSRNRLVQNGAKKGGRFACVELIRVARRLHRNMEYSPTTRRLRRIRRFPSRNRLVQNGAEKSED